MSAPHSIAPRRIDWRQAARAIAPWIVPILLIYRKYYGWRMTLVLLGAFYLTMVVTGYVVELVFGALGLPPDHGQAKVVAQSIEWNYTTVLNLVFAFLGNAVGAGLFVAGGYWFLYLKDAPPAEPRQG